MKKILAMILALTMILSLAACGAGEAPATDPVPVETQPQVTDDLSAGCNGKLSLFFHSKLTE